MNESTARNIRVQDRYDELMRIGRHGHYETMFQVVREEIESLRQQLAEQAEAIDLQLHTNRRIAELEQQLAFATQEQNGYREAQDRACEERDEARQQVTLLRFKLFYANDLLMNTYHHVVPSIQEALDATKEN